jgi:hypothetical protein
VFEEIIEKDCIRRNKQCCLCNNILDQTATFPSNNENIDLPQSRNSVEVNYVAHNSLYAKTCTNCYYLRHEVNIIGTTTEGEKTLV